MGRDRGFCPRTFAPVLVPTGHRDKNFFLSRDKGTTGRPVPWKPYYDYHSTSLFNDFLTVFDWALAHLGP